LGSSNRLDQADLLNEEVQTDELQELLSRLAATEALFSEPIPTIRDVAEATDASPLLIGRILSQMRGPDQVAELKGRMEGFEARLRELEADPKRSHSQSMPIPPLFRNSSSGSTSKQEWVGSRSPTSLGDPSEQSWSKVKQWYDPESSSYISQDQLGERQQEIGKFMKSALMFWIGLIIVIILIAEGSKTSPAPQSDRVFPFPAEQSIR
jgi:hypothetical protein